MKIEEEYTSFTGLGSVGNVARFIKVSDDGYEVAVSDIVKQTKHFFKTVLYGNPFSCKAEIPKLIRETLKHNPESHFDIFSKSNIRPVGLGKFENVKYYVEMLAKKTGLKFDKRINMKAMEWYIDAQAFFIFTVKNEDEVDEAITTIGAIGIPKQLVYMSPEEPDEIDLIMEQCFKYKFNIAPNFKKFLWNKLGRE